MRIISRKKSEADSSKKKVWKSHNSNSQGKLNIVGIGPGDRELLSLKALDTIKRSEVIVGYNTYVRLLGDLARGKKIISSGMRQEIDRARLAIEMAQEGKRVCLISSGDPGVYGMVSLVLELLKNNEDAKVKIEIVPAITALTSCSGLLGAPIGHDFAVISLSDLLTNLSVIKKRIVKAAQADFVIVFYNPKSQTRIKPLQTAWKILIRYKPADTPVGIVRNATREGQEVIITTLKDMLKIDNIDMVTTIFIGNSQTYVKGPFMITPRGYTSKVEIGAVKRQN